MRDSDYPWEVIPDSDGYVIRFPDLPGCMTQVERLHGVGNVAADIRDLWLETAREAGMAIPEPGSHERENERLRELDKEVRSALIAPSNPRERWCWVYDPHCENANTIGRLLEEER